MATEKTKMTVPSLQFVSAKGKRMLLRPMETKDYPQVRELLPKVSTCHLAHSKSEVQSLLALSTYHPVCAFWLKPSDVNQNGGHHTEDNQDNDQACMGARSKSPECKEEKAPESTNGHHLPSFGEKKICGDEISRGRTRRREDEEVLVGFAELYQLPHMGRRYDARLERVVVTDEFRGEGLGTRICEYLVEAAKTVLNCGRVDLTVERANAKHIYEQKLKFSEVETTCMRLHLAQESKG